MDQSGTTATALLVTQDVVIAAVLGDSRGVLASAKHRHPSSGDTSRKTSRWKNFPEFSAVPFSIDHVASDPTERELVRQRGGFVTMVGHTARVNGTLAITRSIGDANLAHVLSREPHVRAFDRSELRELCGDLGGLDRTRETNRPIPCFAILASDGLWDVMSNQEAVDMVVEIILRHNMAHEQLQSAGDTTREVALVFSSDDVDSDSEDNIGPFQASAERLAVEAYVRGSTDNIGVCVVAID
jgi:serine/threonine protein phosphatase PrpC